MATNQYIRVKGDLVEVVQETVQRAVSLSDLMNEVGKETGVITPVLPLGCRLFSQKGDRTMFVIEQAPTTRQVELNGKWKLALPYVVFVVVFSGAAVSTGECKIFYRTSPLGSGDDKICRPNLCNTYQDGRICTGNVRVSGDTLAQKAEAFVAGFWGSQFNWDLAGENFNPAAQNFPQVRSLEVWQEESAKNPLFPLGISWFEAGRLADVIEGRS